MQEEIRSMKKSITFVNPRLYRRVDVRVGPDPLLMAVPFATGLRVRGVGRGAKARDEDLRPAALAAHVGRRARKGRVIDTTMKVQCVTAL